MKKMLCRFLLPIWDVTGFKEDEMQSYSSEKLLVETRRGLVMLCTVFALMMLFQSGFYYLIQENISSIYTCMLLSVLAGHVALSSRSLTDLKSIHLLGMTILVVSGVAFILLAQQTGTFNNTLFVSITMLFMVIPMVPWGLREGLATTAIIYATFTLSTSTRIDHFDQSSLWILQFVMIGSAVISLLLVARNAGVRKLDLQSRFDLEQAHNQIMVLSNKDPLTGAWNRRYFAEQFATDIEQHLYEKKCHFFACLDIDDFKPLNDTYGHTFGDHVLQWLVQALKDQLGDESIVVRMGGDEFALFFASENPAALFEQVQENVRNLMRSFERNRSNKIGLSVGIVSIGADDAVNLDCWYRQADLAMYRAKDLKTETVSLNIQIVSTRVQESGNSRISEPVP